MPYHIGGRLTNFHDWCRWCIAESWPMARQEPEEWWKHPFLINTRGTSNDPFWQMKSILHLTDEMDCPLWQATMIGWLMWWMVVKVNIHFWWSFPLMCNTTKMALRWHTALAESLYTGWCTAILVGETHETIWLFNRNTWNGKRFWHIVPEFLKRQHMQLTCGFHFGAHRQSAHWSHCFYGSWFWRHRRNGYKRLPVRHLVKIEAVNVTYVGNSVLQN